MCIVTDCDFVLLFDGGEEWAFVVHAEREDAMLIGNGKAYTVDGAVFCATDRLEIEAMERRKHGEFKLESIAGRNLKGNVFTIGVFGDFDVEDLETSVNKRYRNG